MCVCVHRLVAIAILVVPFVASAEPEPARLYARVGAGFGAFAPDEQGDRGLVVYDGALAVRFGEIWVRGALTHASMNDGYAGSLLEWHAGVEWKPQRRPDARWFIGLDAGWANGDGGFEDGGVMSLSAPFVMPRAGYEIGGDHVRVQLALELMFGYGHFKSFEQGVPNNLDTNLWMKGMNLTVALTVR